MLLRLENERVNELTGLVPKQFSWSDPNSTNSQPQFPIPQPKRGHLPALQGIRGSKLDQLPRVISERMGAALPGVAANRQVCPTISEMTFGNHSKRFLSASPRLRSDLHRFRLALCLRKISCDGLESFW